MPYTAFQGLKRVAAGSLGEVATVAFAQGGIVQVFDDDSGQVVDLDPRQTYAEPPRGRGRPKLGVIAREVTLLPRHWDWLAAQPGGASATLRRMIDETRKSDHAHARQRRDAAYRVMSALGGDLPGFEEASRSLFANDLKALEDRLSDWPQDVRSYVLQLLRGGD